MKFSRGCHEASGSNFSCFYWFLHGPYNSAALMRCPWFFGCKSLTNWRSAWCTVGAAWTAASLIMQLISDVGLSLAYVMYTNSGHWATAVIVSIAIQPSDASVFHFFVKYATIFALYFCKCQQIWISFTFRIGAAIAYIESYTQCRNAYRLHAHLNKIYKKNDWKLTQILTSSSAIAERPRCSVC